MHQVRAGALAGKCALRAVERHNISSCKVRTTTSLFFGLLAEQRFYRSVNGLE